MKANHYSTLAFFKWHALRSPRIQGACNPRSCKLPSSKCNMTHRKTGRRSSSEMKTRERHEKSLSVKSHVLKTPKKRLTDSTDSGYESDLEPSQSQRISHGGSWSSPDVADSIPAFSTAYPASLELEQTPPFDGVSTPKRPTTERLSPSGSLTKVLPYTPPPSPPFSPSPFALSTPPRTPVHTLRTVYTPTSSPTSTLPVSLSPSMFFLFREGTGWPWIALPTRERPCPDERCPCRVCGAARDLMSLKAGGNRSRCDDWEACHESVSVRQDLTRYSHTRLQTD